MTPPSHLPATVDFAALQHALASHPRQDIHVPGFRESAVLVPILDEENVPPRLILTRRHAGMRAHAGQIAFPGGKRDQADADAATTATRETTEELGIAPAQIQILGRLDALPTPSGYNITPVVARIAGPLHLAPSAAEVAEVFLIPLASLADPATYRHGGVRAFLGVHYDMHEYHHETLRIWGATAYIIRNLLAVLTAAAR